MNKLKKNLITTAIMMMCCTAMEMNVWGNVPAENAALDMMNVGEEAETAYQQIIASYLDVLQMDSGIFLSAPENYFNGDHAALFYYHTYHGDEFYQTYEDLNGDETEELLIGSGPEGYIRIVDLYCFDGVQAVQMIDEPSLGDRSTLSLLQDGTLYLMGSSSAEETSQVYLRMEGNVLVETSVSNAEEVILSWQKLGQPAQNGGIITFDSILTDITTILNTVPVEDYDANMAYYDEIYSHLGGGMVWLLLHREVDIYTMCIWSANFDIDSDGVEELCIGRGVSPSSVELLAFYDINGEAVWGDAIYSYMQSYDYMLPVTWNYVGG